MNSPTTSRITFATLGALASVACALTLPVSAQSQVSGTVATGGGGLRVQDVQKLDDADVHSQALEIRVENGKISAKHNGKEIPPDQIRAEGGRIIVLDENGEPLNDLNLFLGDATGQVFIDAFGNATDWQHGFQVQAADGGKTPPVMLGVTMSEPGKALEKHLRLKEGETTMISGVYEGLAAHDAGIGEFDIITEVNGNGPADAASIRKILADAQPGQTISLTVIQAGKSTDVRVKLQKYDGEALAKSKLLGSGGAVWGWSGVGGQFPNQFVPLENDSVFVAPHWDTKRFELLQPKVQELLRQRIGEGPHSQDRGRADTTEEQLERLDKRMAELEALLERLVEKQGGAR